MCFLSLLAVNKQTQLQYMDVMDCIKYFFIQSSGNSASNEDLPKDNPGGINEENIDKNNNKENDFVFAMPSMSMYRSATNAKQTRPISAPPELMVKSCIIKSDH